MRTAALFVVALSIFVVLSSVDAVPVTQAKPVGTLDGLIFEVETFDESGKTRGSDQFVFADGKLATAEMRNLSCWPTNYTTKPDRSEAARGESIPFEATFATPEGHAVQIKGVVKDERIEGSLRWPDSDSSMDWTFVGQRVDGLLDGLRFRIETAIEYPADFEAEEGQESDQVTKPWEYALPEEFTQGTDVLFFEGGGFESKNCSAVGFSRTYYSAAEYDGAITFAASAASEVAGTVEWSGSVEDDVIEGELKWTSLNGEVLYYSFKGKRKTG